MKIFYVIPFIILASCTKDNYSIKDLKNNEKTISTSLTLPKNKGLEASFNDILQWNPNTVFFTEYNTYSFEEKKLRQSQRYDMWAVFDNDDLEQDVKAFLLNGKEVPKGAGGFEYTGQEEKNKILKPLFGTRITTKIDAEKIYAQEVTYDLPQSLLFTNDFHKNIIFLKTISPALKRGTSIEFSWIPDPNSKMGIAVICQWNGKVYENYQWVVVGGSVENIEVIKDEGKYTFSERMLKNIPDGVTEIVLTFIRGNGGVYSTVGDKDIRHALLSSTSLSFVLVNE